jgi:regulatory protein
MPRPNGTQRLEARRRRLERHAAVEDPAVVLNAAARFLELRSRSVEEIRRHLAAGNYPPELIERAVGRLLELGVLDDRAFGRAWVESRDRSRPRGEQALRHELALKGLDRDLIAEVLAERAGEIRPDDGAGLDHADVVGPRADARAAEKLLRRRSAALARIDDPRRRRQRAYALLARNGFGPEICREASALFVSTNVGEPGAAGTDAEDDVTDAAEEP